MYLWLNNYHVSCLLNITHKISLNDCILCNIQYIYIYTNQTDIDVSLEKLMKGNESLSQTLIS